MPTWPKTLSMRGSATEETNLLGKVLRIIFGAIGILTGFTVANTLIVPMLPEGMSIFKIMTYVIMCLLMGVLLFYLTGKLFNFFIGFFGKAGSSVSEISFYEIAVGTVGFIVGLIIANLISIPISKIAVVGNTIAIMLNILLGLGGMYFAISKKDEISFESFRKRKVGEGNKVLDSCVLIDGRIIEIIQSGFIDGRIVIPQFIVKELQSMADSQDSARRTKGRRGLEILENLVKNHEYAEVVATEFDETGQETDVKLLKFSEKKKCRIITTDYNLNKVAAVTGIGVMNLNELAMAVKKMAYPGEKLYLLISREGKENGQGVGYLEDGAMVIVENGRNYIGKEKEVTVTSVTQTSAGRLIFSRVE